jgi:hypothetical protein
MLPRVSLLEAQQNPRSILELLARVSRKLALVYLPVYVALMVVGRDFIVFLFTRQYLDSWPIRQGGRASTLDRDLDTRRECGNPGRRSHRRQARAIAPA